MIERTDQQLVDVWVDALCILRMISPVCLAQVDPACPSGIVRFRLIAWARVSRSFFLIDARLNRVCDAGGVLRIAVFSGSVSDREALGSDHFRCRNVLQSRNVPPLNLLCGFRRFEFLLRRETVQPVSPLAGKI